MRSVLLVSLLCGALCACVEPVEEPERPWDEVVPADCDAPQDGFDRFVEATAERGIIVDREAPTSPRPGQPPVSSVVAIDGDADGDVDLFFPRPRGVPLALENDGSGVFTVVDAPLGPDFGGVDFGSFFGLADVDGDRLPDLVMVFEALLLSARNLGGLRFEDPVVFHTFAPEETAVVASLAFGDLDGDGDLDLVLPRNERLMAPQNPPVGLADLVFLRDEGTWTLAGELDGDEGGMSLLAAITDFDGDGDGDVLVPSDLGIVGLPPTALYRNDGDPLAMEDVAADEGADLAMSGMGIDAADLNDDGELDYCITDVGPIKCLLSGPSGFVESGLALGLSAPDLGTGRTWSGWSMDLADFDADGHLDLAATGAPPGGPQHAEYSLQPDAVWRGSDSGFVIASESFDFDDQVLRYGLATADLDGDGFLELILAGKDDPPRVFWNRCGEAAWLGVELRGGLDNSFGYGARVSVDDGSRVRIREVQALRSQGQGPGWLHFGLGDADTVNVDIRWPGGEVTRLQDVPTRRRIVVQSPD
jgi:hypothetical protein